MMNRGANREWEEVRRELNVRDSCSCIILIVECRIQKVRDGLIQKVAETSMSSVMFNAQNIKGLREEYIVSV